MLLGGWILTMADPHIVGFVAGLLITIPSLGLGPVIWRTVRTGDNEPLANKTTLVNTGVARSLHLYGIELNRAAHWLGKRTTSERFSFHQQLHLLGSCRLCQ